MGNDCPQHGTVVVIQSYTGGSQRTAECECTRMPYVQAIERRVDTLQAPAQNEQAQISNHDDGLRVGAQRGAVAYRHAVSGLRR